MKAFVLKDEQFVTDAKGRPVGVLLDLKTYERLREAEEDLADIRAYDAARPKVTADSGVILGTGIIFSKGKPSLSLVCVRASQKTSRAVVSSKRIPAARKIKVGLSERPKSGRRTP
jgi:hypothetical protein